MCNQGTWFSPQRQCSRYKSTLTRDGDALSYFLAKQLDPKKGLRQWWVHVKIFPLRAQPLHLERLCLTGDARPRLSAMGRDVGTLR